MARQPDVQYIQFYTDGSAARKVAPVAPLKTIKLHKVKKQKRILVRIDPVATAGIIMAVVMMVLMAVGVAQLRSAQLELASMEAYVDTLREENTSLNAEFSQGYNLEDIEKTALALGMVPMDQVRHVTIQAPETEIEKEPGAWERFYIFLTGLFA